MEALPCRWLALTAKITCRSASLPFPFSNDGKLKLDYITILMNLKVVEQPKDKIYSQTNKRINENPKCLLAKNKEQKISRNERCEATGKKFKNCCGAL